MKIEKLKVGQTLYSAEKRRMGNTMMKSVSVYTVVITKIEDDGKSFWASWNSNPPNRHFSVPSTWKTKKPVIKRGVITDQLAHRDEIKEGRLEERSSYYLLVKNESKTSHEY